jgi:hypothetical protein
MVVKGRIPVISVTGWGVCSIPLKRNDGNDAHEPEGHVNKNKRYVLWSNSFRIQS